MNLLFNLLLIHSLSFQDTSKPLTIDAKIKMLCEASGYLNYNVIRSRYIRDQKRGITIGLQVDKKMRLNADTVGKLVAKYKYLLYDFILDKQPVPYDECNIQFYTKRRFRERLGVIVHINRNFYKLRVKTSMWEKCDIFKDILSYPATFSIYFSTVNFNLDLPDSLYRNTKFLKRYSRALAKIIHAYIIQDEYGYKGFKVIFSFTTKPPVSFEYSVNYKF